MGETTRNILVVLIILFLVAVALPSTMGGMMMWPAVMGRWGGWPWAAGGMWLGGLAMLVLWAVAIVGVVLLVRVLGGLPAGREVTPLDILKRRYASGEITRDQYEQMRKDLES